MKMEGLKPGQVVWSVERRKLGNTELRTTSVFAVVVKEVCLDAPSPHVVASWNGNRPQRFYRRGVSRWRKDKPLTVSTGLGARLATRDEIKAMKEAKR